MLKILNKLDVVLLLGVVAHVHAYIKYNLYTT